jgi:hypothetical protein
MAVPRKLVVVPNAATRELWRIAETGEMDELEAVLSRADVNARNEHGMTALMRAAYHGRVQMVRVLLEHGADPNVTRNDNFTALALAAFFGHAEIVDLLLRHGAKTDVTTRFGTSPNIWARARSFGDVARSLEKRNQGPNRPAVEKPFLEKPLVEKPFLEKPVVEKSVLQPPPPPAPKPEPLVVRTLKEPPEIWDLVHEAPRNFNARSAFMARMRSPKAALAIAFVLLVLIGGGVGAAFFLKQRGAAANASSLTAPAAATTATGPATAATTATGPAAAATVPAPAVNQASETTNVAPQTPAVTTEPLNPIVNPHPVSSRSRSFSRSYEPPPVTIVEQPIGETVAAPPSIAPARSESRAGVEADTKKPATTSNSQVITAPKTPQPKAKVIQWP